MIGNVDHFIGLLERIAPARFAEAWDNVGLQIGSRNWPVKKIWTALDPLPEVVTRACENDVDLLVTHHPLFFKPIKRIDCEKPLGRIVQAAVACRLAVYSAHTNLDSAVGGVNDALAERIGLADMRVLADPVKHVRYKLVIFVPSAHIKAVLDALFELKAGRMGNYSCCTFRCEGVGTFYANEAADPALGKAGAFNEVHEHRLEIRVDGEELNGVIDAIKKSHPYESMAYDIYALDGVDQQVGLGRVGELPASMSLAAFAEQIKTALNMDSLSVVGDLDTRVKTVAVCSGSGASLFEAALGSGAQVYVSGDLGYHTAREAQQAGIGLVDVGHFGSERLIADVLASSIRQASKVQGVDVVVETATMETDPFHHL